MLMSTRSGSLYYNLKDEIDFFELDNLLIKISIEHGDAQSAMPNNKVKRYIIEQGISSPKTYINVFYQNKEVNSIQIFSKEDLDFSLNYETVKQNRFSYTKIDTKIEKSETYYHKTDNIIVVFQIINDYYVVFLSKDNDN